MMALAEFHLLSFTSGVHPALEKSHERCVCAHACMRVCVMKHTPLCVVPFSPFSAYICNQLVIPILNITLYNDCTELLAAFLSGL